VSLHHTTQILLEIDLLVAEALVEGEQLEDVAVLAVWRTRRNVAGAAIFADAAASMLLER